MSLFTTPQPLAARMRPRTIDEFVGQQHFFGPGKLLRRLLQADRLSSVIFYGPPGSGKTSLAHVIARHTRCHFRPVNAVASGIKELREVLQEVYGALNADYRILAAIGARTALDRTLVLFKAPEADGFAQKLNFLVQQHVNRP